METIYQYTLADTATLNGVGLHTGKEVQIKLHPASENHGIVFKRIDLEGNPTVPAEISYVKDTNRSTTLANGIASVTTVEHLLAALHGMGIDNVLVEINGPELPILDGSARHFVEAIKSAGIQEQSREREYIEINKVISYNDEETGAEIVAMPSEKFEMTVLIDFNSDILGHQYAHLEEIEDFAEEIAPCRTFVFVHELECLLKQGLIKGGDLNNAIVIADKILEQEELKQLASKLERPEVKVEKAGILNTVQLQFENEPARHKLLDVLGDLSLVGRPIKGKIMATKPGHKVNVRFTKLLKKHLLDQRKLKGKPEYDPTADPVYNLSQIKEILPHRYPFLLIDKIIELSDNHVVGIKNVTFNEPFFRGHFPENPVFPGVLQVEAMAQAGGVFMLSQFDNPKNYDTFFLKIEKAKFKKIVVPGDTIILKLELLSPIRRGLCHMNGIAYVGNSVVSEGEFVAKIIERKD